VQAAADVVAVLLQYGKLQRATVLAPQAIEGPGRRLEQLDERAIAAGLGVPAATLDSVTIGKVHGDATPFGQMALSNMALPSVSIPDIVGQGVDSVATPKPKAFHLDLGCLDLVLKVNPQAQAHIDQLVIHNVKASTSIGKIELHNIVAPYELLNLTPSQVGIDTISVPTVALA